MFWEQNGKRYLDVKCDLCGVFSVFCSYMDVLIYGWAFKCTKQLWNVCQRKGIRSIPPRTQTEKRDFGREEYTTEEGLLLQGFLVGRISILSPCEFIVGTCLWSKVISREWFSVEHVFGLKIEATLSYL